MALRWQQEGELLLLLHAPPGSPAQRRGRAAFGKEVPGFLVLRKSL